MTDADRGDIGARKRSHLQLSLNEDVGFRGRSSGFDRLSLVHDAMPELHPEEIDLSAEFLGFELELPLLISSMTGGTDEATELNTRLARAAAQAGCAMAVGSQRAGLESEDVEQSYRIRDVAPDVPLFANLGAVQLNYGYGVEQCLRAVEMIEADALFLHLNSLQESLQPGGDVDFRDLREKIAALCHDLPFPVLLKTTGNGISARTARKLVGLPIAGLEASGAGGTSWARIESMRGPGDEHRTRFADWGESTADSVRAVRSVLPDLPLVASGGVAHGDEVAKALALGADLAGIARPLLREAHRGEGALEESFRRLAEELRISCFYCGRGWVGDLVTEDLCESGNSDPFVE
jgi:isopentenyl-diphosphate Delta-isomerase